MIPESANTARQSSHSSTKPPSVGASIGAMRIAVAVAASAAGCARRPEVVEDGRAHHRHRGTAAEGLHHARDDEHVERLRDDAGGAAEDEEAEREKNDPPPAVAVRERRHHEVAERDREDRQADEQLRRVRRDLHGRSDRGQGRQQHVQAESADRADDRRACDQPPGSVAFLQAVILQPAPPARNRPNC